MKTKKVNHEFVDYIPKEIEESLLYISIKYKTAVHKCPCGCKEKIVTPISPVGWELKFNGETVTLDPSIGNWKLNCKSHYWIKNGEVVWSYGFSDKEMQFVDSVDKEKRENYFSKKHLSTDKPKRISPWNSLINLFRR